MSNSTTNNGSVDALGVLLKSCISITNRSLAYRTLARPVQASDDELSVRADIAMEQDIASWLDRRIMDYRARLHSSKSSQENSSNPRGGASSTKALHRAILSKQQELLDESIRQHQERLLLTRILRSRAAVAASFPSTDLDRDDNGKSSSSAASSPSPQLLLQQAIQSRNRQVALALEQSRELETLRTKLGNRSEQCQRLQRENRVLYETLQKQRQEIKDKKKLNNDTGESSASSSRSRMARENVILKRVMADLLAGSGLDWSGDARLQEIMTRVGDETDELY